MNNKSRIREAYQELRGDNLEFQKKRNEFAR